MSVSARPLLVPGLVLATAGAIALTPALTTPLTAAPTLPAVPSIHVGEIALAGIGRDIYDEITDFVQYTVSSAQFWIDLVPIIGPPLAEQLGIVYFQGIQPLIANTVYYASDLIADPFNIVPLTISFGYNVFYTGYTFVSAEAQAFGLPGLAPIPAPSPLASVPAPGRGAAATVAATTETTTETTTEVAVVTDAPVKVAAVRAGSRARAAAPAPRPAAARAAASTDAVAMTAAASTDAAATDAGAAAAPQRQSAKAARSAARSGAAD